jgi:hypothetical protein
MTTSLINFVANGTVTVNTQSNITSVGTLSQLTVAGNTDLGNVGNVRITGGVANYVLVTNGAGNLSWVAGGNIGGGGTVTNVNTSGSGLGFTLTGGPITTTGTVALTVPNATTLRTNLTIGNVANLNLNSNSTTYLDGSGSFSVPAGTYSNSNVANYLPTYTGNLSAGNANITSNLSAGNANITSNLSAGNANITSNLSANNANITSNLSANNANITNTLNGNIGNFIGNISSLNANLGNLARANYFQGDGSLLTNLPVPNYANFAGTLINGNSNVRISANGNVAVSVAGNSNVFTVTGTGANINGLLDVSNVNVASNLFTGNANITYNLSTGNITTGNANITGDANITGNLIVNLNINGNTANFTGNINSANANLGNLVTANYYAGNGSLLTGITAVNANFANYAGNVTVSAQPNITSVGNLTSLTVTGTSNLSTVNASSLTVNGISNLNSVSNLIITGGLNGYYLQTDGTGNLAWVVGGGSGNGVVAGSNTQIQYNNQGNFGGTPGFTFDNATSNMNVPLFINSTSQNGNPYMTGWESPGNMGLPSLISGEVLYAGNVLIPSGSGSNGRITIQRNLLGTSNIIAYSNIGNTNTPSNVAVVGTSTIGNNIFAVYDNGQAVYSINNGNTWANTGFSPNVTPPGNISDGNVVASYSSVQYYNNKYYIAQTLARTPVGLFFSAPIASNIYFKIYSTSTLGNAWTETTLYSNSFNSVPIGSGQYAAFGSSLEKRQTSLLSISNAIIPEYNFPLLTQASNVNGYLQTYIFVSNIDGTFSGANTLFSTQAFANAPSVGFGTITLSATTCPVVNYNGNLIHVRNEITTIGNTSTGAPVFPTIYKSTDGLTWSNVSAPNANVSGTTITKNVIQATAASNNVFVGLGITTSTPVGANSTLCYSLNSLDNGNTYNITQSNLSTTTNSFNLINTTGDAFVNGLNFSTTINSYIYTSNGNIWNSFTSSANVSNGGSATWNEKYQSIIWLGSVRTGGFGNIGNASLIYNIPQIRTYDTNGVVASTVGNGNYQYIGGNNLNASALFVKTANI